jgi:C-terminal processing protease CtpA/Prc
MWVDGFQLSTEQADDTWSPVEISNPGFEAAETPVGWSAQSRGYAYTVTSENAAEGHRALRIAATTMTLSGALFDALPASGEVVDRPLGRGLRARIPLTLWADSSGTLPHSPPEELARLNAALDRVGPAEADADDVRTRLAAIVIAWNVFEHFYPYFDVTGVDWGAELDPALRGAFAAPDGAAFLHTLNRLVARLEDGHGRVNHPRYAPDGVPPIRMEWIDGQVVVTASRDSLVRRGDAVVAIDGTPTRQLLQEVEEEISGSPQWKRWRATTEAFAAGRRGTKVRLTLERAGRTLEVTLTRGPIGRFPASDEPPLATLAPGVKYVDLSRATWDDIRSWLDTLAGARGVVFDLRGYPAGNHRILAHLLSGPDTSRAWMRIPRIIYPNNERVAGYQEAGWGLEPATPHIGGRVVFLTDARAISYAESVMGYVEGYHLGEIVGQPTAGTNGNVNPFSVPGGYTITWTGMRVVRHDGSQQHLLGIRPTVTVERTRRGILLGQDEVLQAGLRVLGAR